MASDPIGTLASAGRSAGRSVGHAIDGVGDAASHAAGRAREEAEDIWAEARQMAGKETGRDAAVYTGLAATAALGALELPVAAAVGAGYMLLRRRR